MCILRPLARSWRRTRCGRGCASVAALLLGAAPLAADEPWILASYSFEDGIETGPDTFRIFEHAQGTVTLTQVFHVSGYRAIELKDIAHDKHMPEIQGYFPVRRNGKLYAHFSFLTATPKEQFNIALAGPEWFRLAKDGIGFWLKAENGKLVHVSDSISKELFAIEPFLWYSSDVAYDVEAGTYDLTIHQEGKADPLVDLHGQKNAPNQPGSAVDKFSFVGEPWGDESNVTYYVDDIVIGTSERVKQLPFVAPGRRKLFVDAFADYRKIELEKPRCLPAEDPEDFALGTAQARDVVRAGSVAMRLWTSGCSALEQGDTVAALGLFERAAETAPEGRIYALSAVIALRGQGRAKEADERIGLLYADWGGDPRYAIVSAMVGAARGDLETAETWLRDPAEEAAVRRAGRVSEQYFQVLLWNGRQDTARDYALRVADRLKTLGLPEADWIERTGDAAFYAKDLVEARIRYQQALALRPENPWPLLKLADIAFLTSDLQAERELREKVYGALVER